MGRHIECLLQKEALDFLCSHLTWVGRFWHCCVLFYRFINARRRIVQPMIDQSNRAGKSPVVTVFKSRRCKSSTSQSPPDIPPGNHGNDVFDTGGWKHGRKDKMKLSWRQETKKMFLRNFMECIFFSNSAAIFWHTRLLNTVTWPGAIDQSEKTFTSTVNMHALIISLLYILTLHAS